MKVKLRAIEPEDLDLLYSTENDSDNWVVGAEIAPISRRDLENYLYTYDRNPLRAGNLRMVICQADNDTPIGLIDLYNIDARNLNAMVGITISTPYRSNGYARDAIEQLCRYSVDFLNLNAIGAYVAANNISSIRLFEAAEFTEVGRLPKWLISKGNREDMILFCRTLL